VAAELEKQGATDEAARLKHDAKATAHHRGHVVGVAALAASLFGDVCPLWDCETRTGFRRCRNQGGKAIFSARR
jgi:hypothetical protein